MNASFAVHRPVIERRTTLDDHVVWFDSLDAVAAMSGIDLMCLADVIHEQADDSGNFDWDLVWNDYESRIRVHPRSSAAKGPSS